MFAQLNVYPPTFNLFYSRVLVISAKILIWNNEMMD